MDNKYCVNTECKVRSNCLRRLKGRPSLAQPAMYYPEHYPNNYAAVCDGFIPAFSIRVEIRTPKQKFEESSLAKKFDFIYEELIRLSEYAGELEDEIIRLKENEGNRE